MTKVPDPRGEHDWPPRPHDPRDRIVLGTYGPWEVCGFEPGGRFDTYFAERGMKHLQFWLPEAGFSLLTPSRLTGGRFEVFPFAGWKHASTCYGGLIADVASACGVDLPPLFVVLTLASHHECEFVELAKNVVPGECLTDSPDFDIWRYIVF